MKITSEEKLKLLELYPGYKVYGPYARKSDGRFQLVLSKGKTSITKLLAKFRLELKLGKRLSKDETVDHIDGNSLNDSYENLRLLTRQQNSSLSVKRLKKKVVSCVWCSKVFIGSRCNIRPTNHAGPFCSKACSGKYGASVQNGADTLPIKQDLREHYTLQNP